MNPGSTFITLDVIFSMVVFLVLLVADSAEIDFFLGFCGSSKINAWIYISLCKILLTLLAKVLSSVRRRIVFKFSAKFTLKSF